MSIGAPRNGGNALTAMSPQTGGPMQPQAGGTPNGNIFGVEIGPSYQPNAGGGGPIDPRSVFGSFWQPQGLDYGLGGGQQPNPYITASPYATFPINGEGQWAGWQPRQAPQQMQGDALAAGAFGMNPYIDARRSQPIPLPADRMPRTGGPMQGQGGGADRLNALVLAALANRPAQTNDPADERIRRFMGMIGR